MPAYKIYRLPLSDGSVPATGLFHNDGAAMTWGLRLGGPTGAEVWQEGRFVGRLFAGDPSATSLTGARPEDGSTAQTAFPVKD